MMVRESKIEGSRERGEKIKMRKRAKVMWTRKQLWFSFSLLPRCRVCVCVEPKLRHLGSSLGTLERERESSVMTLGRNDGNDLRGKVGWWEKRGRILWLATEVNRGWRHFECWFCWRGNINLSFVLLMAPHGARFSKYKKPGLRSLSSWLIIVRSLARWPVPMPHHHRHNNIITLHVSFDMRMPHSLPELWPNLWARQGLKCDQSFSRHRWRCEFI